MLKLHVPAGASAVMLSAFISACLATTALAEPLVIDGNEIASSELFEAAKAEGSMVIYGTLPSRNFEPIEAGFEADTGIQLEYINLITPKLYARATAEHAAGRLEADWVDTTDLPLTQQLVDEGILGQGYKVPNFDAIREELRDPEGRWYAIFRTPIIVGVNTAIVAPEDMPKSWTDLLDPKWQGKLGVPAIDAGGSWFNAYSFLKEQVDDTFWGKLAAQSPRVYPSSAPMLTDLVRGETSLALSSPASIRGQIESGAPVTAIFPSEGVSAYSTSGGITTEAPHPNAAKLFLNWVTSVQGSNTVSSAGIYGLNPDAAPPTSPGIEFPTSDKLWSMSVTSWNELRESYSTEWRGLFGQN